MNNGDTPVLWVYPPENLSDESVHAISDYLYAICSAFDQQYHRQLMRRLDEQDDRISNFHCEIDEDNPF